MPFDSGKLSLTMLRLRDKLPENILEKFGAKAACKLDEVNEEAQTGWVSGRHLLEREIDETTSMCAGFINLSLRSAKRKIPAPLLKAECRKEELEYMRHNGLPAVPAKIKREIKKNIESKRLSQMPPSISGTSAVIDRKSNIIYLGTSSQKAVDNFVSNFFDTLKLEPVKVDFADMLHTTSKLTPEALPQLNFCEKKTDDPRPEKDFLTWLWFFSEKKDGKLSHKQYGKFEIIVDGPMNLASGDDADGANETVVRKGCPARSAEAKAALSVGKKLKKATIILSKDKEVWKTSFDADSFTFGGLSLPEDEESNLDQASVFQERMGKISMFFEIFTEYFREYVDSTKAASLKNTQKEILNWAQEKDSL